MKHFCCWVCDLPLAGHQYIPVEGMPHCLACWQLHHGKTCAACQGVIHPQVRRNTFNTQRMPLQLYESPYVSRSF